MLVRKSPIAILLTVFLALASFAALASDRPAAAEPTTSIEKVTDPPTLNQFPGSTPSHYDSSRFPGRIWTDKSVLDQQGLDASAPQGVGRPPSIVLGDDELAVVLSARASTIQVSGEMQVPVDLVLVLDNSRSMAQCVTSDAYCDAPTTYTGSRAYAMTQAVNDAITIIAANNPANRVAIVQFGTGAGTLFALATPQVVSGTSNYVTLAAPTTSGGTMTFRTASNSMTIGQVGTTVQSTNIQLGIAVGMGILADQTPTTVSGANQRIPNVLVFTDGEPTLSSTATAWWDVPISSGTQGPSTPGGVQYYGNGFKAALTASYLKNKINDVYNDPAYNAAMSQSPIATHVYTVGLGLPGLTTDGYNLSLATLDPSSQVGLTTNTMNSGFTSAWATYSAMSSVTVPVAAGTSYPVQHPTDAGAKYDPASTSTGLRYNDATYEPTTAGELIDVFKSIAQRMVDTAPNFPVEVDPGAAASSGYITFTDPLGPFMQVTQMTRISVCPTTTGITELINCQPQWFDNPVATDLGGGVTRYTFKGEVDASVLAGPANVDQIIITVRQFQSLARGDEVTVQIPATLLPLRYSSVVVDLAGNPLEMTQYVAQPLHVYYKVAPKPGVLAALADPVSLNVSGSLDGTALVAYIASNTYDGKVRFYTNSFANDGQGNLSAGTTASWRPSERNGYYRFGFDTPLYSDESLANLLTKAQWDALGPDDPVWYYSVEYVYTDASMTSVVKTTSAQQTTKALLQAAAALTPGGADVVEQGGFMIAQADLLDLARPGHLDQPKCLDLAWEDGNPVCQDVVELPAPGNLTGTADMNRLTTFDSATVLTALGNNGYLAAPVPGALSIRKNVAAANGLNPDPNMVFAIQVDLNNSSSAPLRGTFPYNVVNLSDTTKLVASGQFTAGGTIGLKGGQQVTIVGLPEGATYVISEKKLSPGYTLTGSSGASGTITWDGQPSQAVLTNTYSPAQVDVKEPAVTKTLNGREWASSDVFNAMLCPQDGATSACEVAQFTPDDMHHGTANFASYTFTAPGTYDFLVAEDDDQRVEGVSYSGAVFRWTVVVADDGSGKLTSTDSLVQLRDDGSVSVSPAAPVNEASFTNTYDADALTAALTARKMIDDDSTGSLRAPLGVYEFGFEYLGVDLPDGPATALGQPPAFGDADASGIAWSQNDGAQVTSSALTFTGDDIGHAFYYRGWEQAGTNASITYSDAVWYWRVVPVVADGGAMALDVTHCLAHSTSPHACDPGSGKYTTVQEEDRVFINEYSPAPASVNLLGSKTVDGRPWITGEQYSFTLAPNDTKTAAAIDAGSIVLPADTAIAAGTPGSTAPAAFSFDGLEFSQQGSYQFAVTEDAPDQPLGGVILDERTIVYQVVIGDANHDGTLTTAVTIQGDNGAAGTAQFVNRYRATLLYGGIDVIKTLTGRSPVVGEFAFTIDSADQASCDKDLLMSLLPAGQCSFTVPNSGSDPTLTQVRDEFNFTQDDLGQVYGFTVREANTNMPGVTYDDAVFYVTLETKYDLVTSDLYVVTTVFNGNADGKLVGVFDSRDGTQPTLNFTNGYDATPVTIKPMFSKVLTGREWSSDDAFTFKWTALTDDAPMPGTTLVTVANAAQAAGFSFGSVTFSQPGTYTYSVSEVIPDLPVAGMLYDDIAAVLTVVVTDDGQGQLAANTIWDGNEQFVNRYAPAWITLRATVFNLPGAGDPKGPTDVTLTANSEHAALAGNGTGSNASGGVERAAVLGSAYSLGASDLSGYEAGIFVCTGEDADGRVFSMPNANGVVSVPSGTHVTCAIEYRPSHAGSSWPGSAQTGGQVTEGAVALPIILAGLASIIVNWRRRLNGESDGLR